MRKILLLTTLFAMTASPLAQARDTTHNLPLADVIAFGESTGKLDGSVKFYLAGQKTPKVARTLGSDISNKKTNGFNKSDEEGCRWAALSALIAFQNSAKQRGANAVVNMTSFYKRNETRSSTTYECHAGAFVVGTTLKGDYAVINR
ncbi:hypothetical protein [Perlucidibaca piscinae]|uniref:hypothetical protein n=1 Tax=Perlucidibaca piscinae TaxID=392589 RepID=UPI0003B6D4FA|nr:hypothetical protein [Perlucidibaca piscinae]